MLALWTRFTEGDGTSEITLRKQPLQSRAKATCGAIREAAARILVADGTVAFNTNAIAERAGVSVGTLYQYYPGKEAILAEMVRNMRAEMLDDLRRGATHAAEGGLEEAVHLMIAASLKHHRRDPALAAALERAEETLPMDSETATLKAEIHDLVGALLASHGIVQQEAPRDLSAIARGIAQSAAEAGETDYDDVARRIARAAMGYLSLE